MDERCLCSGSFPSFWRSNSLAFPDRAGGGPEPGVDLGPSLCPGWEAAHSGWRSSSATGRDGLQAGIRGGRWQGSWGLRTCLLCSTDHRFLGLSEDEHEPWVSTKLWVHPFSFAGTSILGASLSSSQGIGRHPSPSGVEKNPRGLRLFLRAGLQALVPWR